MVLTRGAIILACAWCVASRAAAQASPGPRDVWLGFRVDSTLPLRIADVVPGSPAERAGLTRGDTLTSVMDLPATMANLRAATSKLRPNDILTLDGIRGGQARRFTLHAEERVVSARPESSGASVSSIDDVKRTAADYLSTAARALAVDCAEMDQDTAGAGQRGGRVLRIGRSCFGRADSAGASRLRTPGGEILVRGAPINAALAIPRLRVEVVTLSPALAAYFPRAESGALVIGLLPDRPGESAGIAEGDVVVRVDGETIRSAAELRARMASVGAKPEAIEVAVVRHGREQVVAIR